MTIVFEHTRTKTTLMVLLDKKDIDLLNVLLCNPLRHACLLSRTYILDVL